MKILKHAISALLAGSAIAMVMSSAIADTYPSRPIKLIVPFPPGGGNDVIARVVGHKLGERLGQSVVIENRAGSNGIIGLQALMNSAPDGYTIGVGAAGPMAVNPSLYEKLPYDPVKDFVPISNLAIFPLLLVANPSFPAKNVPELIARARAHPGEVMYASGGSGNSGHLAGELFNSMAGVQIGHIPYKGQGPAVADVLGGHVPLLYSSIPSVIEQVRQGRLRALAVCSLERLPSLPDVPTVAEGGVPGYEAYSWVGLVAPAGTPKEILARLHREVAEILKDKEVVTQLVVQGALPVGNTPEAFGAYINAEIKKWGAVVKSANIKVD